MIKQKKNVLDKALEAVQQETGKRLKMLKKNLIQQDGKIVDAIVEIAGVQYHVEVKKWTQQANFGALVYQVQDLPGNKLLVADYVNKKLAARLKDAGVQFIDTAGNAYIDQDNLYLNIRGNDPVVTLTVNEENRPNTAVPIGMNQEIRPDQRWTTGRAFTPTGLKVVYELILDPDLINRPYRYIADRADVALGTVGWVLNDLTAKGLVANRGKKKTIRELKVLIETWAEAYPQKLRQKQLLGRFFTHDPTWWKKIDLKNLRAQWGGEVAAAEMTNYLRPQKAIIYLRGDLIPLMQQGRMTKVENMGGANVEIYKPFWNRDLPGKTVHPLIVYADLIVTGDPRNLETAKLIYDNFIDKHLG
jgi:hypothetical protein